MTNRPGNRPNQGGNRSAVTESTSNSAPVANSLDARLRKALEQQAKREEYMKKPEVVAKRKEYMKSPQAVEKRKKYMTSPEAKAKRKAYQENPAAKAKRKTYQDQQKKVRNILAAAKKGDIAALTGLGLSPNEARDVMKTYAPKELTSA